jgi:hypothetical protein
VDGVRRAAAWCFRDRRTGRIVVGQFPNPPLIAFLALSIASRLVGPSGRLDDGLRAAATGALAWWAVDEVLRGVNPWRRSLGVAGLVVVAGRL